MLASINTSLWTLEFFGFLRNLYLTFKSFFAIIKITMILIIKILWSIINIVFVNLKLKRQIAPGVYEEVLDHRNDYPFRL